MANLWKLLISIVFVLAIGYVGSIFTTDSISNWYKTLNKPSFNPPNWLFGPVWTILYILIGISLYLVWVSPIQNKTLAYTFFAVQLFLNLLWSFLFFRNHMIGSAFIEIILLWFAILMNILYSYSVSKTSAYLLIPYILWVTFAALLNFSIWKLN